MRFLATLLLVFAVGLSHAAEQAMPKPELIETSCAFMVSASGKDSTFVPVPGLSVLHPPASQPHLDIQLDPGASMDGVVCWRSRAEIGLNDDWVARTGVPLYVKEEGGGPESLGLVLELTEVGYRVRIISGPELSREQADQTVSYIESFNLRRQSGINN